MICVIHAVFFDAVDLWIDIAPAAVEIGGMNVDDQGFTADIFGMNACRIGEPIV